MRQAQKIRDMEMDDATTACHDFKDYGDHVMVVSAGHGNFVIDYLEKVNNRDDMIDCVDARFASVKAWVAAGGDKATLTLRQTVNIEQYANNHFPSRFMAHTVAQWREAFAHRDERQSSFDDCRCARQPLPQVK